MRASMLFAAGALVLAASPVAGVAAPATPSSADAQAWDALFDAGIPCPVENRGGRLDGFADRSEELLSGRASGPEVLRGPGDDLVTMRWRSVHARPVSEEIPVLVEEGTVGITVRAEAARGRFLISVELLGPDGTVLACHDCGSAPAVGEVGARRGTTQMPSTDRPGWELTAGRYTFRVRALPDPQGPPPDDPGTDVDVTVTLRSDAAAEVQRFVDLNFVYLPGCGVTAEIAQTSPRFAEVLARTEEYLAPTGIRLGEITHHDLDLDRFSVIATWEEAGQLFDTSSRMGRPRALNVYCVGAFEPPLLNVVGLSGGIPGPSLNGTHDSGVIIRTSPMFVCGNCVDAFASLFSHEFGHYFGLYHTTEANQQSADPFADTPRCTQRSLRDCPDYDYVMFPLIHSTNVVWSPGQIEVVRTHPIVYTVPVLRPAAAVPAPEPDVTVLPNPFEERVELALRAAAPGAAGTATIYDVAGRRLRDLKLAGDRVTWDGRDAAGARVPGGVYFARVTDGAGSRTVRIVKVK